MIGPDKPLGIFCMDDSSACFALSNAGESCEVPVSDETLCQKIGNIKGLSFTYVNLTGEGVDLPYGCISDTLHSNPPHGAHRLYWNPLGVAVSNDTDIRQICVAGKQEKELQPICVCLFHFCAYFNI